MYPNNEKFWSAIDYLTAGSVTREFIIPLQQKGERNAMRKEKRWKEIKSGIDIL